MHSALFICLMVVAGSPDLGSNMTALNVDEQSCAIKCEKSDGSGCVVVVIISIINIISINGSTGLLRYAV